MRSLPPLEVLAVAHYAFRRIEDLGPTEAPSDLVPRAAQLAESALRSEGRTEVPPIAQLRNHLEERQSRLDERAPPLQSPLDWSTYHRLSASVALLDCVMSVAEVAGMDATAAGEHAIAYEAARVLTSVAMSMERYYDELDWQVELLWAVLLEPVLLARH
ncbi:MAG: hypothetical protein H6699_00160 [Myxococcales bacterium]|nr:hypothetical protein [Myxococcales bacterium]